MKFATVWMLAAAALACAAARRTPPPPRTKPPSGRRTRRRRSSGRSRAAAAADEAAPPSTSWNPPLSETEAAVVVAKVNDKDITEGDLQKVMRLFKKQMGARVPPDQMEAALPKIRERIVEELVMRQIMLAEVAKQGVSLSDTEFAEIKGELAEELPPGTTLESYMAETGTTEAEMREQMAVRKMIMAKAESLAKPTDEEIQKFYDENKEGFAQGESVTASHILIKVDPTDDDAAKAAKRARIE
jgi:parvulin-like peptidyl-prolyl isomerase